jgi:hypothetical protein
MRSDAVMLRARFSWPRPGNWAICSVPPIKEIPNADGSQIPNVSCPSGFPVSLRVIFSFCGASGTEAAASQHLGSFTLALLTNGETGTAAISSARYGVVIR